MNFGINLSTAYVLDQDNQSIISSLDDLGANWVRLEFNWYEEHKVKQLVKDLKTNNIKVLGLLTGLVPGTIKSMFFDKKKYPNPYDKLSSYLAFVKRTVKAHPEITHWEVWNEPNFFRFWRRKPQAEEYLEVLKEASKEIKKIQPNSFIIMGSLCGTNKRSIGGSQTKFLNNIPEITKYIDAYAIHPYTMYSYLPFFMSTKQVTQQVKERISEFKKEFPEKPLWITEYGISSKYFLLQRKKIKSIYKDLLTFCHRKKSPFFLWHLLDTDHNRYSIFNPETKFGIFDRKMKLKKFFR